MAFAHIQPSPPREILADMNKGKVVENVINYVPAKQSNKKIDQKPAAEKLPPGWTAKGMADWKAEQAERMSIEAILHPNHGGDR